MSKLTPGLKRNCICYDNGRCLHQAAPRSLFGFTECLLNKKNSDPRVIYGCSLQIKHVKPPPPPPPPPPPGRNIKEGVQPPRQRPNPPPRENYE